MKRRASDFSAALATARANPAVRIVDKLAPAPKAAAPAASRSALTKTETAWLARLRADPLVADARPHAITLRLTSADGAPIRYTPDMLVIYTDGAIGLDECKGAFVRDAARIKYEWARQQFPWFRWRWCQRVRTEWRVSVAAGKARLS